MTAKFLLPSVVFVPVTARQPDAADRRCRRLATEVTGTQSAARYGGAKLGAIAPIVPPKYVPVPIYFFKLYIALGEF